MSNSMTLEPVAEAPPAETNGVVRSSQSGTTSPATSPSNSVRKETKALTSTKSLEEFLAVEEALTKSPYIVPRDVVSAQQKEGRVERQESNRDKVEKTNGQVVDEAPEIGREEVERDSVVELVEEYAKPEDEEVSQPEISPQSSPFIEFPDKRDQPLESRESPPSPTTSRIAAEPSESLIEAVASELISMAPVNEPPSEPTKNDIDEPSQPTHPQPEPIERIPETTEQQTTPLQTDQEHLPSMEPIQQTKSTEPSPPETLLPTPEPTIKRIPSIQRRGQEYLSQFLEKRRNPQTHTHRSSIQIIEPAKPPPSAKKKELPWTTLVLWMIVFWSLTANVILMVKLSHFESLDSALVNDAGDAKGPEENALWWGWTRSHGVGEVPGTLQRVHVQSAKVEFATVEMRPPTSQSMAKVDEEGYPELGPWMSHIMRRLLGRILW
jgi:hypothetical protein